MTKHFDFESDRDEDEPYDPLPEQVEKHVTVEGLLVLKFGKIRGRAIYKELSRMANRAAEEAGGKPGVLFNNNGGEFVSFHLDEKEGF